MKNAILILVVVLAVWIVARDAVRHYSGVASCSPAPVPKAKVLHI